MTRISDIIFCMNASSTQARGMCANGILTSITPEQIPGQFSFAVIVTFLGLDASKPHRIKVEMFNESEVTASVEGPMPIVHDKTGLPDDYKGLNLKMDWNKVKFCTGGEYTLTVAVDGIMLGEKKVFVMAKQG
ncbi:MAG: hypothetical protein Q4A83_08810 [Bacillota bacterium]|nr:hypothetical protein [Bacillota bacterium]